MADAMDKQATETQPAVLVAIELSRAGWLLAVCDPTTEKISRRRIAGGDAAGLIAVIGEARRRAEQRAGGPIGAECVFEAGRVRLAAAARCRPARSAIVASAWSR